MSESADMFPYEMTIDDCLADRIGANGLSRAAFDRELETALGALETLRKRHEDGSLPLYRLPETRDDLGMIEARAAHHRDNADDVVILGTGGSSLGGKTLNALVDAGFGPANGPRLHFLDNVDPHTFDHLFRTVDPRRTHFIVISKSGTTAETMTQFLICLAALDDAADSEAAVAEQVTVITEPKDNLLRRLAEARGFHVMNHDPGVGGRYSVLSLVGLLPAAIAGLDIARIREGAHAVLSQSLMAKTAGASDPAVGAAINVGLWRERGVTQTVLMPYLDALGDFGLWFRQLWAESLGKDGLGTTPIRAVGTVDQHSQVQLYLAGPADKLFTFVFGDVADTGRVVPADLASDPALDYLAGRKMGDLLDAEQRATAETMVKNGRPVRIFRIGRADEYSLGGLMMHYMLETIVAAHLLGVDPFDQPAVEEGKVLTREYMRAKAAHG